MTPAAAPPFQTALLDQPLPVELTGRHHGWVSRYRTYPVFSPRWVLWRWRLWGPCWALGMLFLAGGVAMAPPADRAWALLAVPALQTLLPMVALPWLCLWVRRQGWPPALEWRALVAVFLLAMAALAAAQRLSVAEPLKQWLSEQTGMVDASGKRRRVLMSLGVRIQAESPASVAATATPAATNRQACRRPAHRLDADRDLDVADGLAGRRQRVVGLAA